MKKRTRVILTLATMAEHAHNKAIITNVPAGEVTQESNVKWLTAVCPTRANTEEPARQRKEDLFALALLATEELFVTRGSHVIQILVTMEESVFLLPMGLFADVPPDIEEKHVQRRMNANQILV